MSDTMSPYIYSRYRKTHLKRLRASENLRALCALSVAIIIAIFLADGGLYEFYTLHGVLIAFGQLTGLIATNFLLIQLLLASRLPLIDKTFGHDRAMLLHQQLGKPALILLLLHGVFLTSGYGIQEGSAISQWVNSILTMPDMWFAVIGLALILLVVGTSLVIVRKRLDYDLWFMVHLLAYAGVAFSIPHQFSDSSMLAEGTIGRVYWFAFYVIVALSLLVFRFFLPAYSSLFHALYVSNIKFESSDVVTLTLKGRQVHKLRAKGGQFFMWRFWSKGMWWHAHPFSLSAAPDKNTLRITIRALGNGSEKLQSIQEGTKVSIQGPYGIFSEAARTQRRIAFITSGIGVTPIRALLEDTEFFKGEATLVIRKPLNQPIYLYEEIMQIAEEKNIKVFVVEGPRSTTASSWLTDDAIKQGVSLLTFVPDLLESDLYVCGPVNWTDEVLKEAKAIGLPRHQMHWERFNW